MKPSNLLETQPMDSVFQDSGIEGLVARLVRYLAEENHDEFGEIEWEKYKSWQVERRLSQFTAVDVNSIEWWELLSNTSHNYKSDYEAIWCRLLNEKVSILKTHNIIATNGQYITNQNDWLKICDSIQHPEQMQVLLDLNPVKEKLLIENQPLRNMMAFEERDLLSLALLVILDPKLSIYFARMGQKFVLLEEIMLD